MKTTIEISDPLLVRAKKLAAHRGTTLRAVLESALRAELEREARPRGPEVIRTHTFRGRGLQQGLTWSDWATIRQLSYEGRGG